MRRDGTLARVLVSSAVCGHDQVISVAVDLSWRAREEARHVALLESSLDAIVTMDQRGDILDFNPAAERMFGHRVDDAVGRSLADLIIPGRLREAHQRGLTRYVAEGHGPSVGTTR